MKMNLDISCELSAWQTIHMICQDLFLLKNKKYIFQMLSAAAVIGALRVKFFRPMTLLQNKTQVFIIAYIIRHAMSEWDKKWATERENRSWSICNQQGPRSVCTSICLTHFSWETTKR